MCRLIETISVIDGELLHLADHQDRMDRSIHHFFGSSKTPPLESLLRIPGEARQGWHKCRVVYSRKIEEITWEPYRIRPVSSLSLIHADHINYGWKLEDRKVFYDLIQKVKTDDIIIVKNGYITDSSYANLLFRCGQEWFTPSTPLLEGTQRNRLIGSGAILEEPISTNDLYQFDRIKWINAMLDMDCGPEWPMDVLRNT